MTPRESAPALPPTEGWVPAGAVPPSDHHYSPRSREAGLTRPKTIFYTAAALAGLALGAHAAAGDVVENVSLEAKDATTHVEAVSIHMEAQELDCNAVQVYDIKDSVIKFQAQVKGYDIPQVGVEITYKDPSKIALQTCQQDTSSFLKGTNIIDGPVDEESGKKTKIVKVPVDSIVVNAQFPTGNKTPDVNQYAGLKIVGGIGSILSGGVQATCVTATLNKFPQECADFAGKIDGLKRDLDSKAQTTADDAIIKFIEKEGSTRNWENVKKMFTDKYRKEAMNKNGLTASEAIRLVNVQFVDESGNPTTDVPDFNKDIFESLRKAGIINRPNDLKVDTSRFKIIIPTPYASPIEKEAALSTGVPTPSALTTGAAR